MRVAQAHLESISPYSQGRKIQTRREERESPEDHEKRCWRERMHVDGTGECFIPPTVFKNMIAEAAKFTPRVGPGGGSSRWTKNFEAGIMVLEPLKLGITPDHVQGEWLFVPADGQRGGKKRVDKCFPLFPAWSGIVAFQIVDDSITQEIFELYLKEAGLFIGIGRFRPRNNGYYGRFRILSVEWGTL